MKPRRAYLVLAAALVIGAPAVLLGLAYGTTQSSDPAAESEDAALGRGPAAPASRDRAALAGNPLWGIPLDRLSTTRDRPLFSPSRRPPPVAAPVAVAAAAPALPPRPPTIDRPEITLLGTIVSDAGGIGIFVQPATRAVVRLHVGEDHQGWALRAVQSRQVTLAKDHTETVLELPSPGRESANTSTGMTPDQLAQRSQPR